MFLPFDNIGQPIPPQRIQIGVGLSEFPKQQRHMPRLYGWQAKDVFFQPTGERFSLSPCGPGCIECFIVSSRPDELKANTGVEIPGATLWANLQSNIGRLNVGTTFEQSIEYIVHRAQHGGITTEIRRQRLEHTLIRVNLLDDPIERFDVGTSKGIDRLFRVTHDEEFSWFKRHILPIRRVPTLTLGHGENNLVLHRVGILELVHENSTILAFEPIADRGMVTKQRACACEESVKG